MARDTLHVCDRVRYVPIELIADFDLQPRNTLAVPARSRYGALITTEAELVELVGLAEARSLALRVLGGGSNVVLGSEFDGITAIMAIAGRKVLDGSAEAVLIEAGAGETWHDFVAWSVAQGLGGLENLAGIPGTVGAAPVQNIGAYGIELADRFESLTAFDHARGQLVTFERADCGFSYRDSVFKQNRGRYSVTAVRFRLPRPWVPVLGYAGLSQLAATEGVTPGAVMETVVRIRGEKLPDWRQMPNAGSFFHNPVVPLAQAERALADFPEAPRYPAGDGMVKLSAGWLIEKSGLKGFRLGPVAISERHALVVTNPGRGTQADIAALATHVKQTVEARFGVRLTEEPIFM